MALNWVEIPLISRRWSRREAGTVLGAVPTIVARCRMAHSALASFLPAPGVGAVIVLLASHWFGGHFLESVIGFGVGLIQGVQVSRHFRMAEEHIQSAGAIVQHVDSATGLGTQTEAYNRIAVLGMAPCTFNFCDDFDLSVIADEIDVIFDVLIFWFVHVFGSFRLRFIAV